MTRTSDQAASRTMATILLPMTLPFLVLPLLNYPLATIMSALLKALL